ncbi:MAG TPA: methyltransferase domain-containing protein [Candidatus Binatia bacterium]|jgi:SAM-dependent methyltransferase
MALTTAEKYPFIMALRSFAKRHQLIGALAKKSLRLTGRLFQKRAIQRYLAGHPIKKLQLGAQINALPGWLNTDLFPQTPDIVYLDATKHFPFADGTFDYIFTEHHLEHLSFVDGRFMLKECFRVMKRGGRIRISVPSLDVLIQLFTAPDTPEKRRYIQSVGEACFAGAGPYNACFAMNAAVFHWGHRFLYDRATLTQVLESVGFADVRGFDPLASDDPHLRSLECRNAGNAKFETLVLEAERPA